jgi:circadian clock protein KaiC
LLASERVSSGISGLDALLGGGFPKGRVILVSGEPGSGKTILAAQYLVKGIVEHGERGVFVCMEENKPDFYREMAQFGWDLAALEKSGGFVFVDATPLRFIPGKVKLGEKVVERKDFSLNSLIQAISSAAEKIHATQISVDSLASLSIQYENIFQRRLAVLDLVGALSNIGSTSIITTEMKSPGIRRILQAEEFLAHGVITMQNVMVGNSMTRVIQIQKMRETSCDNQPRPYKITSQGIEVYSEEMVFK